ncbi:hypothetical protein FM110_01740 [Brachybacterium nesterenkovii]|uniref:Uncharacterized protein n=1 Tax=Brachybacterium nesterenkovii TaxID=47847 RepID=A0A1X6WTK8_9MICO|nr:hypothetical protein FM110_01740 [Brachybacterium nesterenkovii]
MDGDGRLAVRSPRLRTVLRGVRRARPYRPCLPARRAL